MTSAARRRVRSFVGLAAAATLAASAGAVSGGDVAPPDDRTTPLDGRTRPAATTATTAPPPREVTLVATGDVLLHEPLWDQAEADAAAAGAGGRDFRPQLADVRSLVEDADLAVCHLETPVAGPDEEPAGYPAFSVPPEIVPALADTGFDACTTASNHTYDRGAAGVDRTLDALDAAGLAHAGSARTPEEAAAPTLLRVGDGAGGDPAGGTDDGSSGDPDDEVAVALLSYTYGFNGVPAPGGETWRSPTIDEARVRADAATARDAGADIVVVALHWGDEYEADPTGEQRTLGPALVRSPDVDLVLGHHAHVVQPVEHVDGEWVVYGMGNFVAHHETDLPANEEGLLVRFTFREGAAGWRVTTAEYAALHVARSDPVRVVDVGAALATGAAPTPVDPARLLAAWERTTAAVDALGALDDGLAPIGGAAPG